MTDLTILESEIKERASRRGLTVDMTKIRYAHDILKNLIGQTPEKVLVVGIGHGHDVLLPLITGDFKSVVGVDPYISEDGNDSTDYNKLKKLIEAYNLEDRMTVERMTIEEYCHKSSSEKFDLILMNDVLHHIVVTDKNLSANTAEYSRTIELFKELKTKLNPNGKIVVKDVEKHGLRPSLASLGIYKTSVDFTTKQSWREWSKAAQTAGLTLKQRELYIPYNVRKYSRLLNNYLGLYTLCNSYFLVFK